MNARTKENIEQSMFEALCWFTEVHDEDQDWTALSPAIHQLVDRAKERGYTLPEDWNSE